jgi:hypothetical protein
LGFSLELFARAFLEVACDCRCNSTACPPFNGDVCPCVPTNTTAGDFGSTLRRSLDEGPSFGGEACPKHTPAGGDVLVSGLWTNQSGMRL